ncbi:helix-turn-helix domain-containing protein [Streptomyces sp. TRM72054]|uniref:IclR family transcriptional regulator n=1 Tax=Streptomyces sp. TRM72054 TaxID=2870562 RepID=UPI001C8B6AA3|nr:helix-turn-helix domain-containing protein [Streptomyces sp. TRM72054]MBX9399626.1 helix-turn-helix domain-containing protein [Streptomyces sp. TRM72054]
MYDQVHREARPSPALEPVPDTAPRAASDDGGVRVIEKAFQILRTLSCCTHPASLAALARESGLPKTTVHRLIRTLEAQDVVYRVDDGYQVSQHFGAYTRTIADIRDQILPALLSLYERTHLLVQLMVLEGQRVRCIEKLNAITSNNVGGRGTTRLARQTAAGKLLLALTPSELPGGSSAEEEHVRAEEEHVRLKRQQDIALKRELIQIRNIGVAFDQGGSHHSLMTCAAPVYRLHQVVAAISVSGPSHRVTESETCLALQHAARLASAALRPSKPPEVPPLRGRR